MAVIVPAGSDQTLNVSFAPTNDTVLDVFSGGTLDVLSEGVAGRAIENGGRQTEFVVDQASGTPAEWAMANGTVSQVAVQPGAASNWHIVNSG